MQQLHRDNFKLPSYPTRILQFGEGNFLRAFVDWQFDILNELTDFNAGISVIRPIDSDFPPSMNTQSGLYTTLIRGLDDEGKPRAEERIITSINNELSAYKEFGSILELAKNPDVRFVVSNTTEAGITFNEDDKITDMPPSSFPAKLILMLLERFEAFDGVMDKGLVIIPCELIDYNGEELKQILNRYVDLWGLSPSFRVWLNNANTFCSTLVDRIVPGYPKDEIKELEQAFGYKDNFVVNAEWFYSFVIQAPKWLEKELCLDQLPVDSRLNIKIVDDIKPYKERKVAILNGAHTALVPVAFQAGLDTVGESMDDEQMVKFMRNAMFDEIIPNLSLPEHELIEFAEDVESRFKNPYIRHLLLSISLNGMTKFKTRILPQLITYSKKNKVPPTYLTFSLAALITFYRGERANEKYPLNDDVKFISFYSSAWDEVQNGKMSIFDLVSSVLADTDHWGQDLNTFPDLTRMVSGFATDIVCEGMRVALQKASGEFCG
ncbi:tagaturonate reductase [Vibrio artabrorum]|uniref:Tagaturonate reductase n=1 Tax=Vibrio artabrorum TaxID=446374 RepID=A0ABT8CM91_9VIBR|nr:tagaturonate reductase [Vibrio artabrorum]MDN3702609.1 tagaturonate reductase [Vibrio artabrorum]